MTADELMIGDWVTFVNGKGERIADSQIDINSLYTAVNTPEILQFEPIPLTKEILEQNGFKMHDFHDIEDQHQWTLWLDTTSYIALWTRELKDNPVEGWMFRVESELAGCCIKIEYVHQLQHALRLCGIDKEIKLRKED